MKKWYEGKYRRTLIDMHVEDWNEKFLSKLSPERYMELIKKADVQSVMVYAQSHVGLCYFPENIAAIHKSPAAQTYFGKMAALCEKEGIDIIGYYSLVYDNWAYEHNPEWRIINEYGVANREKQESVMFGGARYGTCCLNNRDYVAYAKAQINALLHGYKMQGIFLDMTFWPGVCGCKACKEKFASQTGKEIPTVINWQDETWLLFQKKREEWLVSFAHEITDYIRSIKPDITIEHNCATACNTWKYSATEGIIDACDYAGGDLYGGFLQQAFICKYFRNTTVNMPYEYMTSRCDPNLKFHTCTKSDEELMLHNCLAYANAGAFMFIDAINLDGTYNEVLYERMGNIFAKTKAYEQYLGGTLKADVAVFFNQRSKINTDLNGKSVMGSSWVDQQHLKASLKACEILRQENIAYDVISAKNLTDLKKYNALVLSDMKIIDDTDAQHIIRYVTAGGTVYMSGVPYSEKMKQFLGISWIKDTEESFTYICPKGEGAGYMPENDSIAPMTLPMPQAVVKILGGEVLGTITLPATNPTDSVRFASIHSNPPFIGTEHPSLVRFKIGEGSVIWSAAPIEICEPIVNREIVGRIFTDLIGKDKVIQSNALWPVEIMVNEKDNNLFVSLTNQQDRFPILPMTDILVRINTFEKKPQQVLHLPDCAPIPFKFDGTYAEFVVSHLHIFEMYQIV